MDDLDLERRFKKLETELAELRRAVAVLILYSVPAYPVPTDERAKMQVIVDRAEKEGNH